VCVTPEALTWYVGVCVCVLGEGLGTLSNDKFCGQVLVLQM